MNCVPNVTRKFKNPNNQSHVTLVTDGPIVNAEE